MNKFQEGDIVYLKPFKWNNIPHVYIILNIFPYKNHYYYDIFQIMPSFGDKFYSQDIERSCILYSKEQFEKDHNI